MKIETRERQGVFVLDLEGKLAGGISGGPGLSEAVMKLIVGDDPARAPDHPRVLLNLTACAGADSLGIGELISLHVSLSNRGASLKLLRLPDRIRDLLTATQLISMFEIFEDEDEAVESFG